MAENNKPKKNKGSLCASSVAKVGTTALVAGLGLFRTNAAHALIMHTDVHEEIYNETYFLDVNRDQVIDFSITHSINVVQYNLAIYDLRIDRYNSPYMQLANAVVDSQGYAAALSFGETIDAKQTWQYSGVMGHHEKALPTSLQTNNSAGPWPGADNKYLGLQLQFYDGQQNVITHYGWAGLSVDVDTLKATLFGYAYEDVPDKAISAGAVPEPSSLLLLATGATVLLASRRKRKR